MPTALSADFDGAIFLHRVSDAELDFLPGWLRASARTVGFVIARPIASAALAITLLAGFIYLLRRRRSPSSQRSWLHRDYEVWLEKTLSRRSTANENDPARADRRPLP